MYRRRVTEVNIDIEKKVLIGMIISTEYLHLVNPIINLKYFQLDYSKIVAKWVLDYYSKYKQAPLRQIEDIFDIESVNMKEESSQLVGEFLDGLSSEYQRAKKFNADYLFDKSIEYFNERSLILLSENIIKYVNAGRIEDAKKELRDYKNVAKMTSQWIDPFEKDFIKGVYDSFLSPELDEDPDNSPVFLFRMPGMLGELMGMFERGWLVSYLAPRKRGKTFFLQETGVQAATNKLNVCIVSLEMSKYGFGSRLLQRIVAMGKQSLYYYPCFDCLKNQDNSCTKKTRTNNKPLIVNGELPVFSEDIDYKICTACRGTREFNLGVWYEVIKRPVISERRIANQIAGFTRAFGNRMRIKAYPAFSANLKQIISDIDMLEYNEGFVPDVIIIDYADILAPEDKRVDEHIRIDETWKTLKQIAEMRHCLVLTATQGNRKSSEKKNVAANDTSRDISKNDHVDAQYALSQTPFEKKSGVIRVNNTLHRWKEFDENLSVTVLQNLKLSQVVLDSEL